MRPPRAAQRLLSALLPAADRDEVLGDLAERYAARARDGVLGARLWYWRQAVAVPLWLRAARLGAVHIQILEVGPTLRRLGRSPGFTVVAVLSLGLGIGANTAIFGALRTLLYTSLAVDAPDELVLLYHTRPEGFEGVSQINSGGATDPVTGANLHSNVSHPIFQRLAATAPVDVAAFTFVQRAALVEEGRPALPTDAMLVSGDFFRTVGLGTVVGRPLRPDDDRPDAPPVAVISHSLWQSAYGSDPAVVGRVVRLNGVPVEIVGVSRPGFEGLSPGGFFPATQVTMPLAAQPLVQPRWSRDRDLRTDDEVYWLRLIARIPEGTSDAPARAAMSAALRQAFLDDARITEDLAERVTMSLLPGARGLDTVRSATERPLKLLGGVVGLVLLIACVNVATLLLARGSSRTHETAVRKALGAGRFQLVWPLFLESLVVAVAGGALGLLVAWWGGSLVAAALTAGMGVARLDVSLDPVLLAVTGGVSVAAALSSGLIPALWTSRVDAGLRFETRGTTGGASGLARALVVGQIAISVPLVVGGGLLLRTVANLDAVDPGFNVEELTLFRVDGGTVSEDPADAMAALRQLLDNVRAVPGVRSATFIENVLLSGWISNTFVDVDGEFVEMYMNAVGPDFFATMGVDILAGRPLDERDDADAPPVVVVNEAAARAYFGGNAVGRTFTRGSRSVEVVGVASDIHYRGLRDDVPPTFFDPWRQRGATATHVAVRGGGPGLEGALRDAVTRAHPGLVMTDLRTQAGQIRTAMRQERIFSTVLTLFGAFALLLASIGLHGIMAFSVARRRREMGVRLALGARPDRLMGMILRQVVGLVGLGLVLGLAAAALVTPVVEALLFGLDTRDAPTYLAASAVLLVVGVVAGWLPARRAARTDPLRALAAE